MWNIIQCAVKGRSHEKVNMPCQDKTYALFENDVQTIALADGAGSAKLSHFGAETVTRCICEEMVQKFDDYFNNEDGMTVKQQMIEVIEKRLEQTAKQQECDMIDLASTLLFVAIKDNKFIMAHIGDGIIGYLKQDEFKIATHPMNGEFINTTVFTTSMDVVRETRLIKGGVEEIKGFVLMSDGTESSLYNKKDDKFADVVKKIMKMSMKSEIKIVEKQLKQSFENVVSKATVDDCSMIMIVRRR